MNSRNSSYLPSIVSVNTNSFLKITKTNTNSPEQKNKVNDSLNKTLDIKKIVEKYNQRIGYKTKLNAQERIIKIIQEFPQSVIDKIKRRINSESYKVNKPEGPLKKRLLIKKDIKPLFTKYWNRRALLRIAEQKFNDIFKDHRSISPTLDEAKLIKNNSQIESTFDNPSKVNHKKYETITYNTHSIAFDNSSRIVEAFHWEKSGEPYPILDSDKTKKMNPLKGSLGIPKDNNQMFFGKYIRHVLLKDMDPVVKKKYREYANSVNEVPLGAGFLKRMKDDVSQRQGKKTSMSVY